MKIAVLSGKGGTGKTFVSVNLAAVAGKSIYVDCDIEEPNGHLFFKPAKLEEKPVAVKIPNVDMNKCTGCRKCVDFCRFNSLAYIKDKLFVFDEICHSCGGCLVICPEKALEERNKVIGKIKRGNSNNVTVYSGILNTGEVTGTPIVREMLEDVMKEKSIPIIVDCPPGSACIVMDSIKNMNYCVLVAEPTAFGRHNLEMVYELVSVMKKPCGVILNKCMGGENPSEDFCREKGIKILEKIDFDKELGKINSNAEIAVRKNKRYQNVFENLFNQLKEVACSEATFDTKR